MYVTPFVPTFEVIIFRLKVFGHGLKACKRGVLSVKFVWYKLLARNPKSQAFRQSDYLRCCHMTTFNLAWYQGLLDIHCIRGPDFKRFRFKVHQLQPKICLFTPLFSVPFQPTNVTLEAFPCGPKAHMRECKCLVYLIHIKSL